MAVPAYVTGGTGEGSNAQNGMATSAFVATAGRAILACCQADTVDITAVNDTAGNTYVKLGSTYTGGGTNQSFWLSLTGLASATNVVTQSHAGGAWPRIVAIEISGAATSSAHDTAYAPAGNLDSTSPFTTTAANTAANDELVVAQFSDRVGSGAFSSSAPSVFRLACASSDFGVATNDAAVAGSASCSVISTSTTDQHACFAVAIKSPPAGGVSAPLMGGMSL